MTNSLSTLPRGAALPINRCNLPASILGGLTFQQHPAPLYIDGVASLHGDLFRRLAPLEERSARAAQFMDYLDVYFRLDDPEAAGYRKGGRGRPRANWKRMLRGWLFDSDSREGAVLKAWVESRFGLLPRFHKGPIRDFSGETYMAYLEARSQGLYNTNALEAQLDLVYSYCQYELAREGGGHRILYRGVNRLEQLETLGSARESLVVLMNNLNSFSEDPERASEFGDRVLEVRVPREKVLCFNTLFPSMLKGEGEFIVVGGLYRARQYRL